MNKEKKILKEWNIHWNNKTKLTNPIEIDGLCINGKPLDKKVYLNLWVKPLLKKLKILRNDKILDLGSGT